MSPTDTAPEAPNRTEEHGEVTVKVNRKSVILSSHRMSGIDIKRAAIAQHVDIQEDFLLTLEASPGHDARTVGDADVITVTKHSVFTANDGDDDS